MNKIQIKNHNIRFYGIKLKLLCLLTMIKKYILKDRYHRLLHVHKSTC